MRESYLHAVNDNFSRKILAWELAERVTGETTTKVLEAAAKFLETSEVTLMADSGSENVNEAVDRYLEGSVIKRVLALVEVVEPNSMIEAFWRSLRHQWLYLHELDTLGGLRPLVEFYIEQHNAVMPHAAFSGPTPDEVFFGATQGAEELPRKRRKARERRVENNRSRICGACSQGDSSSDSKGVANAAA